MQFSILILLGIGWGLSFSLARMSTEGGMHPIAITYWTCLVSTIALCLYCVITHKAIPISKNYLYLYIVCGLLGTVIPGTLYFYAAAYVSAGVLSITIATVPLSTYAGAILFDIEKISLPRIMGLFLGVVSILLLVMPNSDETTNESAIWICVMVLAATCYSAENLIVAIKTPLSSNVVVLVTGMMIASTFILAPIVLLTGTYSALTFPFDRSTLAIVGMGIITSVAYGAFYYLLYRAGPVFASQSAYLITLSGVIWGIIIYRETHSIWIWLSLTVMLGALMLVKPRNKKD